MAQRAEDRIGEKVDVLVEDAGDDADGDGAVGRALHQGPETDGVTRLVGPGERNRFVPAVVIDSEGVDLVAEPAGPAW